MQIKFLNFAISSSENSANHPSALTLRGDFSYNIALLLGANIPAGGNKMFNKASDTLSDYYYFQADIKGNSSVPDMSGTARFYPWLDGTMVEIELTGMPTRNEPFAVHIHEGAVCEPETFTSAGMHLKSTDVELEVSPERHDTNIKSTQNHPGHMGDLPSIFSNNGYAYMATYTDRFIPRQVEGRTVIVHSSPDTFTSTDTFGSRIACGVIRRMEISKSL